MFLAKYDDKIINIPYRNVYQRTWKLVDYKIYNDLTSGKSIQSQSTTTQGSCGLIYHELRSYRFCNPPTFRSFDYTNPTPRQRPKAEFWIVKTRVRSFGFVIQDFLSHGISIPIGSSNKFTKKLVKMLHQNCNRCGLVNAIWFAVWHWLICNGNFITWPYWNG